MGVIEKVWGTTEALVVTPLFEMHRLFIQPYRQCSLHVHRFKHNAFYVIDGRLHIDRMRGDPGVVVTEDLGLGASCTVEPGLHHRFRTGHFPCEALEMYYPEPLGEDIVRMNVGGPTDDAPPEPVLCERCGSWTTPDRLMTCGYFHTSNSCPHRKA